MKFKGTWVLALLAIALGLYVYLVEFKKAAKDEETKNKEEKILDIDQGKVKTITLNNSHGEIVIEKGEGLTWKLVKPIQDQADETNVVTLISFFNNEKYDQVIEGEDLKNYGLDKPAMSVTMTLLDGSSKKLSVGTDAAIPGKLYVQRNDEKKVLYANAGVKYQLDKTVKDFRDKKIFRKGKDLIQHLALKVNTKDIHGQVSLTKKDNDWILDGVGEKADSEAANAALNAIDGLKATDFKSEKGEDRAEQKKSGLATPALDVVLEGKDNAKLGRILFSDKKDNKMSAWVEGSPTIYEVFGNSVDGLLKKPQDFRDKKKPFEFKKDDVAELYVKTSLADIHLVKKGSSWELTLPDQEKQVSQIQVASLLDKISNLKVAEYVEGEKPKGLTPPMGEVIFKDAKGATLLIFDWGDRSKNQRNIYAKTDKYKGAFTIDSMSAESIPVQTLVEAKPTPTPAAVSSPGKPAHP